MIGSSCMEYHCDDRSSIAQGKKTRNFILRVACTRSKVPFLYITYATPEIVTEKPAA